MMAPSPSKSSKTQHPSFLITADSVDTSPVPSSPPSTDAPKSQCSSLSDGESFECYGDNDISISEAGGVDLELAPHLNSTTVAESNGNSNNPTNSGITRHSWSRTSLRGAPKSHNDNLPNRRWGSMRHSSGKRQLGSNALANHLYRSSSFNSSGRSSNCDTAEDMYSDVSLEDVQDINHKLEILQRQVTNLADTQSNVDDRTSRTKTEYAVLQARYHMLEEQLRETELRAEERLAEEQKRHRELLARVEREAKLQNENCQIRIRTMEMEVTGLREEIQRLRLQSDKQAADLHATEEKLEKARDSLMISQQDLVEARAEEKKHRADKQAAEELMVELGKECERLRSERGPALPTTSPESLRLEELHQEMDELRQKNKSLEEANEELQAMMLTRSVEEGRNLLNGTSNSLAQELEAMSQNQDTVDSTTLASLTQLQVAFQEKEDENRRLKHYIDTMLLNVVENYPQLLEVKAA
ncbi:rab11 family-interacting protein 4A isoform X3 [Anopheles moucheti]|uniref:rab11 family-interacting protein 4A isoform X3 n=2 Tax=Anopheles moucheti TaxID=186751 RepID=UPI0022F04626|nr:rab11 family-interacting protein 4A isoform X3 [Anopheles moucheti]XP_052891768.1 rab11 family-interacting protein 4A isoform X3 [Anopheles moucheti]XP_052891769.1 rab11 family-interacting protein 4A isoform X3 [Anopheles moucheti]XP_052891770.1 rab11 family-interacting protein 4A isoform X3 [Anopheles moucheti]XP_052891771.1 rab11 family-interacting protein 4A isoform X3 [Anopheles moucheti]XP_052891772.1 rab11 family-interacting protein 4A isoform X3 [Anopheles moucheti]